MHFFRHIIPALCLACVFDTSAFAVLIQSQPVARLHLPGNVAGSLSVTATGEGALGYQWFFRGQPMPGETLAVLTIPPLRRTTEGMYHCVVTDDLGSVSTLPSRVALTGRAQSWQASSYQSYMSMVSQAAGFSGGDAALVIKTDGTLVSPTFQGGYSPVFQIPASVGAVRQCVTRDGQALVLRDDGQVVSWAGNSTILRVVPGSLTSVMALSMTSTQGLALLADGSLQCWTLVTGASVSLPGIGGPVAAISSGSDHHLAQLADGTVVAWGDNSEGETSVPAGLAGVVSISAGVDFSVAVLSDGTVRLWGTNERGECTPPAGLGAVSRIQAGDGGVYAVMRDDTISFWGGSASAASTYGTDPFPYITSLHPRAAGGGFGIEFYRAPLISRQPLTQSVAEGDRVVLDVGYTGSASLNVQWYKDGQLMPGSYFFFGLDLGRVSPSAAGSYTAVVTNQHGSVTSQPAVLTVTPGAYFVTQSLSGLIGQPMSVDVSGYGTISYQWYRNGGPISGATASSHTPSQPGIYHVVATDSLGSVQSRYLRVAPATTLASWKAGWAAPSTTTPASGMQVLSKGDPTLCITSEGNIGYVKVGIPQVPTLISGGDVTYNVATGSSWQSYGSSSTMVTFSSPSGTPVRDPSIAAAVRAGNAAVVSNRGTVMAGRSWVYGGSSIPSMFDFENTGPTIYFGTVLPVPALSEVIDIVATDTAFLALHEDGSLTQWEAASGGVQAIPAGLINGPVSAISAGTDHFMALTASGEVMAWGDNAQGESSVPAGLAGVVQIAAGPDFSLALRADGTVVAWGDDTAGQTSVPAGLTGVAGISATHQAAFAHKTDGTTSCWGSATAAIPQRGISHITSAASLPPVNGAVSTFIGHASYTAPSILVEPAALSLLAEDGFVLRTQVVSMLQPSYQWHRDGVPLSAGGESSLTINPARPSDSGSYHVVITNPSGSTTSGVAAVQVADAPSFSAQPQGVVLPAAGGSATLGASVASYSGAPVSYQWYRDGVPVPGGDQAWLVLPSVQPAQAGLYRVIATNMHGSRSSVLARVGISGMPVAWRNGAVQEVTTSSPITLQALGGGDARFAISADLRAVTLGTPGLPMEPPQGLYNQPGSAVEVVSRGNHALTVAGNGELLHWFWNGSNVQNSIKPNAGTTVAASMSDSEGLVIRSDGELLRWQLAPPSLFPDYYVPPYVPLPVPPAAHGALHVTSGADHHLALLPGGIVVAFGGGNAHGQTDVPAGLSNVIGMAAGDGFSLALKEDGTVTGWGSNASGALSIPPGLANVVRIRAGRGGVVAVHADGTITAWGQDTQAGDVSPVPSSLGMVNEAGLLGGYGFALRSITSPIQITEAPQSMKVFFGYSGPSLRVVVSNSPASYQWLLDGVIIPGATNSVLHLQNIGYFSLDRGWYSCVISSSEASHTTVPVRLRVVQRDNYTSWSTNNLYGYYAPQSTPFGHPVPNLLCHALGLDHLRPDMSRLPALCFETDAGSGLPHAGLTFEVPENLNGVGFVLRSTHDLSLPAAAWTSHAVSPLLGNVVNGRRRLFLVDPQPAGTRCFYRLEVLQQSTPSALPEY